MTSPAPSAPRDDNFNAIRLLCAFAIIVSHYFPLRDGNESAEPFMRLSGFCNIGKIVTYTCFVISGLLVTQSYLRRPQFGPYLRHRAVRILPALWATVLFCIAIGAALTTLSIARYLRSGETIKFAANAALYPNHYSLAGVFTHFTPDDPRNAMNGSLWVVAALVLMYLMIPVFGAIKLLRPAVLLPLALLMLAAWEAFELHGISDHSRFYKYRVWIEFIPHLGFFFLCGAAAAVAKKVPLNVALFIATLAIAAVCLRTRFGYLVLSLCIPYLTLYLTALRVPALRIANRAGVIAFGVYLYGWPMQQLVMRSWFPHRSGLEQVIYPCVASVILATLSWWIVERPALRLK